LLGPRLVPLGHQRHHQLGITFHPPLAGDSGHRSRL
jgi:hypothetical protein